MNKLVSWFQSIKLRQIITVFMLVLTFLVGTGWNKNSSALAESVTPEATSYQPDSQAVKKAERVKENAEKSAKLLSEEGIKVTNRAAESAKDPNKNIFESVKEKLNLDEPIDPGTKQVLKDAGDTITGK